MQLSPLTRPSAQSDARPGCRAQADDEGEVSILLAEDDSAVRSLLARVLRMRGYRVIEAENGAEALDLAASAPRPFQLLLTDVVMPRLNGPELARQILAGGLVRQVIFMTGYADLLLDGSTTAIVLQKPFSPATLMDAVRRTLAGSQG